MDKIDFSDWLQNEMNKRALSQSDLARLSGINRQVISTYINRQRTKPDTEVLVAIARALHLPPEVVFQAAGILPAKKDDGLTPRKRQMLHMLDELGDDTLTESIIAMLEKQLEQKQKQVPSNGNLKEVRR